MAKEQAIGFELEPKTLQVTLRVQGELVKHKLRAPTADEWIQYERLATTTSRREDGRVLTESMKPEAAEWLYDTIAGGVEHRGEMLAPEVVPLPHKEAVVDALARVDGRPDPAATSWLDPQPAVLVRAFRDGAVHEGLRHVFRRPTAKEHAEYSRALARAVAVEVGGSRRVVSCSTLTEKIELYDKLIVRVEGYAPNEPRGVDAMHKKVAVTALMEIALGNAETPATEPATEMEEEAAS